MSSSMLGSVRPLRLVAHPVAHPSTASDREATLSSWTLAQACVDFGTPLDEQEGICHASVL